jgi:hypothetical protein
LAVCVASHLGERLAGHPDHRVSSSLLTYAEPGVAAVEVLARWEAEGADPDYRLAVWAVAEALGPGASAFDALVSVLDAERVALDVLAERYDEWLETAQELALCGTAEGLSCRTASWRVSWSG